MAAFPLPAARQTGSLQRGHASRGTWARSGWAGAHPSRSVHVHAAVNRYRRASNIFGVIRGQEDNAAGDIRGFSHVPRRHSPDDHFQHFSRDRVGHLCFNQTWCDVVSCDAVARAFQGQRHGKAVDAGLGGGVIGLPIPGLAHEAADINDPAELGSRMPSNKCQSAGIEARAEVGCDRRIPRFRSSWRG